MEEFDLTRAPKHGAPSEAPGTPRLRAGTASPRSLGGLQMKTNEECGLGERLQLRSLCLASYDKRAPWATQPKC